MIRITIILILTLATAAGVLAVDDLPADVRYEWVNIPARRDVADLLPSSDGYWVTYRGGGAAFYDIGDGSYRLFGLEQGLTHLCVNGVAEDDGYLYFGTRNGLTKLDKEMGISERTMRMWGNAYNDCTGVAVTDRYLYVSTTEGARRFDKQFGPPVKVMELKPGDRPLSKQIDDGWEVYYNPDGVVTEDLYSVLAHDDGTVYWGGFDRLPVQHPDDSWSLVEPDIDVGNITRMRFIGGRLVIFGAGGGYYCDESTGRCEPIVTELVDTPLNDALIRGGYIYLGGPAGLYIAKTDNKKFKLTFGIPVESIGKKKKKKKSTVWLIKDELGDAGVNRIIETDDSIVIGTTDGIYHYDPEEEEFTRPGIPAGLSGPAVYSMFMGGDVIFATGSGGLDIIFPEGPDPAEFVKHTLPVTEALRDAAKYSGDIIILGLRSLFRVKGKNFVPVLKFDDAGIVGAGRCLEVFNDNGIDRLFIGTSGGLFELDTGFLVIEDSPRLRGCDVVGLTIIEDVLYAATCFDGVYGFAPGSAGEMQYHVDDYNGLSGEEIISLNSDGERLFVGFYDKGLDILTPHLEFVDNITWSDGLSHTDIFAAAYDAPYLWISIRGVGINAYNLETGERGDIRKYYARYGLGDEYCRDIEVLGPGSGYDHRIAFATASGVSILCYDGDTPPDLTVGDPDKGYR